MSDNRKAPLWELSDISAERQAVLEIADIDRQVAAVSKQIDTLLKKRESLTLSIAPGKGGRERRYVLFPPEDNELYVCLERQRRMAWGDEEIYYSEDINDYNSATPEVKRIVRGVLAIFLIGDGNVLQNILYKFLRECDSFEEQAVYIEQLHVETIHAQVYGKFALCYLRHEREVEKLLREVESTGAYMGKVNFMEKWMEGRESDRPRWQRKVAFAAVEGIFFPGPFAFIYWLSTQGTFSALCHSNELISPDEAEHRNVGALLANREITNLIRLGLLTRDGADAIIKEIIVDAYSCASAYVRWLLPAPVKDLTAEGVESFIMSVCDSLATELGASAIYNVENTLHFMDMLSTEQKANFYEKNVASYTKGTLENRINWKKQLGFEGSTDIHYRRPEDVDF